MAKNNNAGGSESRRNLQLFVDKRAAARDKRMLADLESKLIETRREMDNLLLDLIRGDKAYIEQLTRFESIKRGKFPPAIKKGIDDLKEVLDRSIVLLEKPYLDSDVTAMLLLVRKIVYANWRVVLKHVINTHAASNRPRGYAAKEDSWLTVLDKAPKWMDQKPRGESMGWAVSGLSIQQLLQGKYKIENFPDVRTINRERRKRLKKIRLKE